MVAGVGASLLPNSAALCGCTTLCPPSAGGPLDCFHLLAVVSGTAMSVCVEALEHLFLNGMVGSHGPSLFTV